MLRKILALAAIMVVCVAGMVGWLLFRFDIPAAKAQIAQLLQERTGRSILFAGPVHLRLWPDFAVRAHDVDIGNPPWARMPTMAHIGQFDVHLDVWPLLRGAYVVRNIALRDVALVFERNPDGGHNADFSYANGSTVAPPQPPRNVSAASPPTSAQKLDVRIAQISLENLSARYLDAQGLEQTMVQIPNMTLSDAGDHLDLAGSLTVQAQQFDIAAKLPSFEKIRAGRGPFDLDVILRMGAQKLIFNGGAAFDRLFLDGKINLSGDVGQIQGTLNVTGDGPRPRMKAQIIADPLRLGQFETGTAPTQDAPVNPEGRATGARPPEAAAGWAEKVAAVGSALDVVLDVDIRRLEIPGDPEDSQKTGTLGSLTARLEMIDGKFSLDPVQALLGGGTLAGYFTLDPHHDGQILMMTDWQAQQINYGDVLAQTGMAGIVSGVVQGGLNLRAVGANPDMLVRNLQGQLMLDLRGGKIDTRYVQQGWFDALRRGLPVPIDADMVALKCGYGVVRFTPGLVKTDGMLLDSDLATLRLDGHVDLSRAVAGQPDSVPLDLMIRMRPAELLRAQLGARFADLTAPVRVAGTLAAPRARLDGQHVLKDMARRLFGQQEQSSNAPLPLVATQAETGGENPCRMALETGIVAPQPVTPVDVEQLKQKAIEPLQKMLDRFKTGQ